MPCKVSYYGQRKPGPGVKPVSADAPPKVPFNAPKYPINPWNGKHLPLHKEPRPTFAETNPSTVVMRWTMAAGGDYIETNTAPTNTSGYIWQIEHEEDEYNVHYFYMVEAVNPSLSLYWDGIPATCKPPTPAGMLWEIVAVVGHAIFLESRCLSMWDEPGYCPVSGDFTIPNDGEIGVDMTFTDGYSNATPGTVLRIGTMTGQTVSVTVGTSGELLGYVGVIALGNPNLGTTSYYRIDSTGRLEQ